MVENSELILKSNVKIIEITNEKQSIVVATHNSITNMALHYLVTRVINKYISSNTTNHILNLLSFGYGASDICTIPSPATLYDVDLIKYYNLQTQPGFIVVNNKYLDINSYITFTSETSWKISTVIVDNLFIKPSELNQVFINEIGVFVSDKTTFSNPKLFARVTTSPLILKPGRVYVLEWNFSLTYEM